MPPPGLRPGDGSGGGEGNAAVTWRLGRAPCRGGVGAWPLPAAGCNPRPSGRAGGGEPGDAGDEAPSEEEFEEDLEEEVVEREALKKQSGTILDRATKGRKKKRGGKKEAS